MDFSDKVAVVTGGASGIGKSIVEALLENKIKHVVILDVNEEFGNKVIAALEKKYGAGRTMMILTDVTNGNKFDDALQKTKDMYGRIDIIVNNVGIMNETNYELMINVNLLSTVHGTHLGYKYLSKTNGGNGGVILNTASFTAFLDFYPFPVYAATKSAIVHLARTLGHPYHAEKAGVRIMTICPGYTPRTAFFDNVKGGYQEAADSFVKDEKEQEPESVGRAAIHVIMNGTSGSAWIVDGGDLFAVKTPELDSCMELVKKNV